MHTDFAGRPIGDWREVVQVIEGLDSEAVPDASIDKTLEWVNYDPDRAKAALTAELSRDHEQQRKGLLDQLQARLKEAAHA